MKQTILKLSLLTIMVANLTACGGGASTTQTSNSGNNSSSETSNNSNANSSDNSPHLSKVTGKVTIIRIF